MSGRWMLMAFLSLVAAFPPAEAQTTTLFDFCGDSIGDEFGFSVAGAGDVNDDGVPDVIVGADRDDNSATDAGSATVYSGADGSVLHSWDGPGVSAHFGTSVAGAGDVDQDGYDDVIVGATYQPVISQSGFAVVYSGLDGTVLHQWSAGNADQLGKAVVGLGDVNSDGYSDVAVGAWVESVTGFQNGGVYVYSGLDGSKLFEFHGAQDNDFFGEKLASGHDVNGDQVADLLVGSRQAGLLGEAHVYSGADGTLLWQFCGGQGSASLGSAVALMADTNNDSRSEILVGDRVDEVFMYSGMDGSLLRTFSASGLPANFGFAVDSPGDTNNDGCPDVVVGAYGDSGYGPASGSVRVLSGVDGTELMTVHGKSSDSLMGWSVAAVGDVDGDGLGDFITGAATPYHHGTKAGYARVYSGNCKGSTLTYGLGTAGSGGFVPELSGFGCPAPTASFGLQIQMGLGEALGLLLVGTASANLPGLGGVLLVAPPFALTLPLFLPGTGAGNGGTTLPAVIDPTTPTGVTVYLQGLFLDAGASAGISMTNGICVTLQ